MNVHYPSGRVSNATLLHHCRLYSTYKTAPIPQLIWSDGHTEWSRWYWFVKDDVCRTAVPYWHFKWE